MTLKTTTQKGSLIFWILLILVALTALKYFLNWDIFDAAASNQGQSTIQYMREVINYIWTYIEVPIKFAWNDIAWPILDLTWQSFQAFIQWGTTNAQNGI